jgi:cbb3-type cytochrome oxidase subunit 3
MTGGLDYATVATVARIFGLVLFFTLFAGIAFWTFRPGARAVFDTHARIPLDDGREEPQR